MPADEARRGAFQVVLISPDGYMHAAAFAELAETVCYGLRALGLESGVEVNRLVVPGPPAVMFGANLLTPEEADSLPATTIIYNLEQIGSSNAWFSPAYRSLLARCPVWDYSTRNIAALAQMGTAQPVTHVPVGYMPQLTRIQAPAEQDIDVLFYGSLNDRRAAVIQQLRGMGLNAQALFGTYGAARDSFIARAKVVLNLHYYETSIFELVRVSYLLANRKAVVAERHSGTEVDADVAAAVKLAPYEELAAACAEVVADGGQRRALEAGGFDCITARDETTILAAALGLAPSENKPGTTGAWTSPKPPCRPELPARMTRHAAE
jgi:hypothetical protein